MTTLSGVDAFLSAYIRPQEQCDPKGLQHRYKKVKELNDRSGEARDLFSSDCPPPLCQQYHPRLDVFVVYGSVWF